MRLWSYLAQVAAKAEGTTTAKYLERQLKESLENVDMRVMRGHRNPDGLRMMAKTAIKGASKGIVPGPICRIPSTLTFAPMSPG
jgi:hypothetical protein